MDLELSFHLFYYLALRAGKPYKCPECARIGRDSYVKPDIVFFGESLPDRFHKLSQKDFKKCDLVIVIGTSLAVYPFAGLPNYVSKECPRLLINRELVGNFRHGKKDNIRDVFYVSFLRDFPPFWPKSNKF